MWADFVHILKERGVLFDKGLSDSEADRIESEFGFRFPPDFREFLKAGLPISDNAPRWRHESSASLREQLSVPLEGILFDVEHNGFWLDDWGERPKSLGEARDIVRRLVAAAPVLIPVFGHRMIPDRPHAVGNPVFSVHQTDIIYYGIDLRDYLIHEFLTKDGVGIWPIPQTMRRIEFWDIDRFSSVRWAKGVAVFDNREGILP